jgi:CRISPR-associated protein Csb2
VLPGSDDHRRTKSEKLLASAISHSGIPSEIVSGITIQKAPFHRRGPATERYFRPEYLRHRGLWHVRLVFRDIVRGPLTLGAGRHVGLGLFAAEER